MKADEKHPLRERRKRKGLCVGCGGKPEKYRTMCRACQDRKNRQARASAAVRRAHGYKRVQRPGPPDEWAIAERKRILADPQWKEKMRAHDRAIHELIQSERRLVDRFSDKCRMEPK